MHNIMNFYELLFVIVLLSALLNSILGFGFAIIFSPVFLTFLEPKIVVQVSGLLTLFVVLILSIFLFKFCNVRLLKKAILYSLPAYPLGYFILSELNSISIKLIAFFVVFLTIKSIFSKEFKKVYAKENITLSTYPKDKKYIKFLINYMAPFFAGFLNLTLAMPGPAIVGYFRNFDLNQKVLKSTLASFMTISYFILMGIQFFFIGISTETFSIAKLFIIPVLAGLFLGFLFRNKVSEKFYLIITIVILITILVSLSINIFKNLSNLNF